MRRGCPTSVRSSWPNTAPPATSWNTAQQMPCSTARRTRAPPTTSTAASAESPLWTFDRESRRQRAMTPLPRSDDDWRFAFGVESTIRAQCCRSSDGGTAVMAGLGEAWWNRYCEYLFADASTGLSLDLSNVGFPDGHLDTMSARMDRVF